MKKKNLRQVGLKTKLIPTLLLVGILPMAALGYVAHLQAEKGIGGATLNTLDALASKQEANLNQQARVYEEQLRRASAALAGPMATRDTPEMAVTFTELRQTLPDTQEISVADPAGVVLASTSQSQIGQNLAGTRSFAGGLAGQLRPDVERMPEGALRIRIAAPVQSNGQTIGVVSIVSLAPFLDMLATDHVGLGETGEYAVTARDPQTGDSVQLHRLRLEKDTQPKRAPKGDPSRPGTYALQGEERTFTDLIDYRGERILVAMRYVEALDWGLIVKVDRDEAFAPITDFRNLLILTALVSAVLLVLVVFEIAQAISGPLMRLARLTERIGSGDFDRRAPVRTSDEIGRLSASINTMADQLAANRDEIASILQGGKKSKRRDVASLAVEVAAKQRELTAALRKLSKSEEQVRHQATHDTLTGLPNRTSFERDANASFKANPKMKRAVLFIDLDRFKTVNDTLGHEIGDSLLKAVAARLRSSLAKEDVLARFGGDEFVALLTNIRSVDNVDAVIHRLRERLREPFVVDTHEFHVDASAGVAMFPAHGKDIATLMRKADTALYEAKRGGGAQYLVYAQASSGQLERRFNLETDLRRAFSNGELFMHYQPIFDHDGKVYKVEALLRWNHPKRGELLPSTFLSLIEDLGLSERLTEWTLTRACQDLKKWLKAHSGARVALNLSARQASHMNLVENVLAVLRKVRVAPSRLELEITETAAIQHYEAIREKLFELHNKGVHVALDDFGKGYSSLNHLLNLPADTVKIDRSFVVEASQRPQAQTLVRGIVTLAQTLNLAVIAEGIETKEEYDFISKLTEIGLQGFYLAPPMSARDLGRL